MHKWMQIDDDCVRMFWICDECDEEATVSPDYYEENGTPVCADCDVDMKYARTEVSLPEVSPPAKRKVGST